MDNDTYVDRFINHAIKCLERSKRETENQKCILYETEVDMIIKLLKEYQSIF